MTGSQRRRKTRKRGRRSSAKPLRESSKEMERAQEVPVLFVFVSDLGDVFQFRVENPFRPTLYRHPN
jgi:hypothetical protein